MKIDFKKEIMYPKTVVPQLKGNKLIIKGPKGETERVFDHPLIKVEVHADKIILTVAKGTKKEKTNIGSYQAHIRNMIKGVQEPHVYRLKICSGHFPMSVAIAGKDFVIKNFFGEIVPRKVEIVKGAEVKINGTEITITSVDKELAGQMASRIEKLCRISKRDLRVFQDGCYITQKAGKEPFALQQ